MKANLKNITQDENAIQLGVAFVLAIPVLILIVGIFIDVMRYKNAQRDIANNIQQSLLGSTQYVFPARGTINPDCAFGAALAQYSVNRLSSFQSIMSNSNKNMWDKNTLFPPLKGVWANKINEIYTHNPNENITTDTTPIVETPGREITAMRGGNANPPTPTACDLDSNPITSLTPNTENTPILKLEIPESNILGINLSGSTVKPKANFLVTYFKVTPAEYDPNSKELKVPSKITMCVQELTPNRIFGTLYSGFMFTPTNACSTASLRVQL